MQITAESLAYWYFRLNGFLTMRDFLVHPDSRHDRGTDVDILGVRFPYRAELFTRPMKDDPIFTRISDRPRPYIVIAEVKKGLCSLNGPWTQPEHRNMHKVLRAIGAFPTQEVDRIAEDLYSQGYFASSDYYLTLFCIGERKNGEIAERYEEVPQAIWDHIKEFVYERFAEYRYQKSWHDPWDTDAKNLWKCMEEARDPSQFVERIEITS